MIKKLHFSIKQKIITAINKICKNEQQQHHQKEKRKGGCTSRSLSLTKIKNK